MEFRIQTGLPPGKPSRHDEELKKKTLAPSQKLYG